MIKLVAAMCAALLTLTACGGGDSNSGSGGDSSSGASADETKAKDNIKTSLLKQGSSGLAGGSKVTDAQAQCVADGLVGDLGVDKLKKYKLLDAQLQVNTDVNPTNLEAADADSLASTIVNCVDFKQVMMDQMSSMSSSMTDAQKQCVSDAIDDKVLIQALSAGFQGKTPEVGQDMQSNMMKCMTPSQ